MRTEHQRHHRQPQDGGRGGGGTVGETPHLVGRLRQQGGQDIPDRAGTGRRRQHPDADGHRQVSALRRGNPCGKPGVQLLQLCQPKRSLLLRYLAQHRRTPAHPGGSRGNLREGHHLFGTGDVP